MIKRLTRRGHDAATGAAKSSAREPGPLDSDTDDADDDDTGADATAAAIPTVAEASTAYPTVIKRSTHKKKKVMVLCSRGVTSSFVELMEDVLKLMPHSRKDPKFDKKEALSTIVEIAELAGCHMAVYLEARKMKDLYIWMGRVNGGPSAKFLIEQVRPMGDLRLTGNCLLGSRPILSFDAAFSEQPHLLVLKELLASVFAPPKGHPRSKPFHDHVLSFSLLEGRVLLRHYQLVPPVDKKKGDGVTLVEIGPRCALVPIRVLSECFRGETLFVNESYVSPNMARADLKRKRARTTVGHVAQKEKRRKRIEEGGDALPEDEFQDVFV